MHFFGAGAKIQKCLFTSIVGVSAVAVIGSVPDRSCKAMHMARCAFAICIYSKASE